jgi:hypothetical protein
MESTPLPSWYVWLMIDARDVNRGARIWSLAEGLKDDLLYIFLTPTTELCGFVLHVRAQSKESAETAARQVAYQGLLKAGMTKRSVTRADATPAGEPSVNRDAAFVPGS